MEIVEVLVSVATGIIVGMVVFRIVFSLFPGQEILRRVDYTTMKRRLGFNRWQY